MSERKRPTLAGLSALKVLGATIIDYKTSEVTTANEAARRVATSLQLKMYALAAHLPLLRVQPDLPLPPPAGATGRRPPSPGTPEERRLLP